MRIVGIIIAIITFLFLIVAHEFGHFSIGKFLGMRINEFSVGMGPLIWSKKKGETQYSLRAVPIGGYCAFEGEDGDSEDERSFSKQPAWAKVLVLLAGAFNNIVIGIIIFSIVFMYAGTAINTIDYTVEGGPASVAGLQAGDKIVEVNDTAVKSWSSTTRLISASEDTCSITVIRDGERLSFVCDTYVNEYGNVAIGIGAVVSHSFFDCLKTGILETGAVLASIQSFFTGLFNGTTSASDVSGVVGIVSYAGETAQYGLINVFYLMAMISANLGYMNLLPFPALDGGRILTTIIRGITGGRLSEKAEAIIHAAGMVVLLVLMLLIMFKDTIGLFK